MGLIAALAVISLVVGLLAGVISSKNSQLHLKEIEIDDLKIKIVALGCHTECVTDIGPMCRLHSTDLENCNLRMEKRELEASLRRSAQSEITWLQKYNELLALAQSAYTALQGKTPLVALSYDDSKALYDLGQYVTKNE